MGISRRLTAPGVTVKIWPRAEIENYLLDPETIARVSGAAPEVVALNIIEAQAACGTYPCHVHFRVGGFRARGLRQRSPGTRRGGVRRTMDGKRSPGQN